MKQAALADPARAAPTTAAQGRGLKILIISYFFPPYNAMGAIRVGKTAKYLQRLGHEVRVVSAADQPLQSTAPLEIERERVRYTRWLNVNAPVVFALGGRGRVAATGYSTPAGRLGRVARWLGKTYKQLTNLPDGEIGWLRPARAAALELAREWRPDLIYASGLPMTALIAAHQVSRRTGIPWVAEMRDLITDEPWYAQPRWRRALDTRIEERVLGSASGLVTTSEERAEILRRRFGKPTEVVLNGFDADDYPATPEAGDPGAPLDIVYTGMIYEGRRDPTPLFEAIRSLGLGPREVRVHFYGRYLSIVHELARRAGVEEVVQVHEPVPYRDSLELQVRADVLLLLLFVDPGEVPIPGKLFEYLGARRPTLVIGHPACAAARLVTERGAGVAAFEPALIASHLSAWLAEKRALGRVGDLPAAALAGLSREDQVRRLTRLLGEIGAG